MASNIWRAGGLLAIKSVGNRPEDDRWRGVIEARAKRRARSLAHAWQYRGLVATCGPQLHGSVENGVPRKCSSARRSHRVCQPWPAHAPWTGTAAARHELQGTSKQGEQSGSVVGGAPGKVGVAGAALSRGQSKPKGGHSSSQLHAHAHHHQVGGSGIAGSGAQSTAYGLVGGDAPGERDSDRRVRCGQANLNRRSGSAPKAR